ncbi:fatty acid desaturase [Amycolatopsis sp. CA-230715]|uniref:fatty acid desaturase n=1 Tax=Amycolatopsis sp. CA-230715 TaxID=2745196 RepID=UPI001C0185E7|nr:fatty acid desaturase [Amycolatopsis sp. CA-230715]QWF77443.1 hypothetical protein HUW46_00835 [Amycolatopsis sp. CA-230715]
MSVVDTRRRARVRPRGGASAHASPAPVSVSAVAVFGAGFAVWSCALLLALADVLPYWATIPMQSLATIAMIVVAHDSLHHASGKLTWVNDTLGRLAMPFVVTCGSFPAFRFVHMEQHRALAAGAVPAAWRPDVRWWLLLARWLAIDLVYLGRYLPKRSGRPRAEIVETAAFTLVLLGTLGTIAAAGHGPELVLLYLLPQRLGAAAFGWYVFRGPRREPVRPRRSPVEAYRDRFRKHHRKPGVPCHRQATAPAPPAAAGRFHELVVSEVRRIAAGATSVRLAVPPDLRAEFSAGPARQVVVRPATGGGHRTYAPCPSEPGALTIAVRESEDGPAFEDLRSGDRLAVRAGTGRFTLTTDPGAAKHYVGLAAGSGITAVLPVLAAVLADEPQSRFTLLYVNRSGASTMFADELTALADGADGRVRILHYRTDDRDPDLHRARAPKRADVVAEALAVSDEEYHRGRLTETRLRTLLESRLHPVTVDEWFVCAPQGLTELARSVLEEHLVEPAAVRYERFPLC